MFTNFDPKTLNKNFLLGCATASYQIEGAGRQDGRSPTIWDTFPSAKIGNVLGGMDGSDACDHYNRLEEDLDMIQDLGFESYRFSIAWSRILPNGVGEVNQKAIDFYKRLLDGLKKRNIKPNTTLYHWDLPQCLQDKGGWNNREISDWFEYYTTVVAENLGDRLSMIATFNEPWCIIYLSHLLGVHAPGLKNLDVTLSALHNLLLSHGKAVKVIRKLLPNAKVGIVNNTVLHQPAHPSNPLDMEVVENNHIFNNRSILDPLFLGKYPEKFLNHFSNRMPEIRAGDMELINQPLDFLGENYYFNERLSHDKMAGEHPKSKAHANLEPPEKTGGNDEQVISFNMGKSVGQSTLKTNIGWNITPWGLRTVMNRLNDDYGHIIPEFYITENGLALDDFQDEDGHVHDPMRIEFIKLHLEQCKLIIEEDKIPLKGYYCWSLMDNYEWAEGYSQRFGMVFCDYNTQKRIPKDSAIFMQDILKSRK